MKKLFILWVVLIFLAVAYLPFNTPNVSGQNLPEREFVKRSFKNEPVRIISLLAPNAKITPGEKFRAGDDWLDRTEFKIQNTSNKTIIGISFMFLIRDLPGRSSSLGVPFLYGSVPERKPLYTTDEPVKANAVITMKITPEFFQEIRLGVEQTAKMADIKRVDMVLVGVYFSDGSCWEGGSFFEKVPAFEEQTSKELPPVNLSSMGFCGVQEGYDRVFCCASSQPNCTPAVHYVRRVRIRPSVNKETGADTFDVLCKCDTSIQCTGTVAVPCYDIYPPIS